MSEAHPTTGFEPLDRLIGGVLLGDNVVWEMDSAAPVERFVTGFLDSCRTEGAPVVYVSFNRSPQTIRASYAQPFGTGGFTLVDCFSSGKGNSDRIFLDFFASERRHQSCRAIQIENPGNRQAEDSCCGPIDAAA